MTMRRRRFGRTSLDISEIVLGGGIVGGILILKDEATRLAALKRCVAAGIDWIDTAASYGNGVSETTIGRYLPELSPRPRVSTKARLASEDLGDIAGALTRSLEASLQRLKLSRVELFQLHNILGENDAPGSLKLAQVLGPGGVADAMDRLKKQGMIRAAGFTALGDAQTCLRVIESGRFESAQVYYNLLNPSAAWARAPAAWSAQDFSGLLAACRRHDVAAMNIRCFAGGALTGAAPHGREVAITAGSEPEREAARAAKIFSVLGSRYGTPAQTALRFSLARPDLACVVVGVHELAHLDEALAAAANGPLPPDALAQLEPIWTSDFH
jgi:D-threo-aldose 1-dehydrogenase